MAAGLIPSPAYVKQDIPPKGLDSISDLLPAFCVELEAGETGSDISADETDFSPETLRQAVDAALAADDSRGFLHSLHLRFLRLTSAEGDIRIAFVDTTTAEETMFSTLLYSVFIFLGSMLIFFMISWHLSNIFLRPLRNAWERQKQFIADASHELKTPLSVIQANSDLLLSHPEDTIGSQHKWLEYIQLEIQRMQTLVDGMLFLARADQTDPALIQGTADLSELVNSCLLSFEPVLFEANLEFSSQVEDHIFLSCDPEQLRRLINVLMDNAVKYTPVGGGIHVTLQRTEHWARLSVTNQGGLPIPAEEQAHIFERFYRSSRSRARSEGGYGLGLSIAQSIVTRHNGTISLESTAENGTTFTVLLPLT